MIISHSHKFIFTHIQRTGGSTIVHLLKTQLGVDVDIISQHGNARSSELRELEDFKNYFRFSFVRNPWDRLLSWYLLINKDNYQNLEKERHNFENFLELDLCTDGEDEDFHYNQLDYLSDKNGKLLVDKIYKFEDYNNEVKSMFNDLNLPLMDIPRMNKTIDKNYQNYYTKKSKVLIFQKCEKDIEYFGFQF